MFPYFPMIFPWFSHQKHPFRGIFQPATFTGNHALRTLRDIEARAGFGVPWRTNPIRTKRWRAKTCGDAFHHPMSYIYIYIYIYNIYIYIHTHIYIHIYTHIYIYIYTRVFKSYKTVFNPYIFSKDGSIWFRMFFLQPLFRRVTPSGWVQCIASGFWWGPSWYSVGYVRQIKLLYISRYINPHLDPGEPPIVKVGKTWKILPGSVSGECRWWKRLRLNRADSILSLLCVRHVLAQPCPLSVGLRAQFQSGSSGNLWVFPKIRRHLTTAMGWFLGPSHWQLRCRRAPSFGGSGRRSARAGCKRSAARCVNAPSEVRQPRCFFLSGWSSSSPRMHCM